MKCFNKKKVCKSSKHESESERQCMEWKHIELPTNKRFRAQESVKKVMLTVFLSTKETITLDLIEKSWYQKQC